MCRLEDKKNETQEDKNTLPYKQADYLEPIDTTGQSYHSFY